MSARSGTYEFGYPKSDYVNDESIICRAEDIKKKLGIPDKFTVLYAPSWEYDGKEEDFIKAVKNLDVNMVVKQACWSESYSLVTNNMRSLHEGIYKNLYYIEPEESLDDNAERRDVSVLWILHGCVRSEVVVCSI